MANPFTTSSTETEILEKNLIKHLQYLQPSSSLDNIAMISPDLEYLITNKNSFGRLNPKIQELYLYFLKMKNSDLMKVKLQIIEEQEKIKNEISQSEQENDELERELKIMTKDKIETINEIEKVKDEIAKYKVYDSQMTNTIQSQISSPEHHSMPSTSSKTRSNKNVVKELNKEREKKYKELKLSMTKMEKGLVEAKKIYEEKKKKNDQFIIENEHLSENSKQKILIIEQLKLEIEQMKLKVDLNIPKGVVHDDGISVVSKSTNVSNTSSAKPENKKGFMGFVKNIFKK